MHESICLVSTTPPEQMINIYTAVVYNLKMYIKDDDIREIIISVGRGYPL